MDIAPFFDASPAVQLHVVAALIALATGCVVFIMRKGTVRHKATGRVWFAAMGVVAISSFGIRGLMPNGSLSPLHLLSVYTLATLVFAIVMVRRGNVRAHQLSLLGLFLGGLVGAGLLTLSRGLLMSRILFPDGDSFIPAPADLPGGAIGAALGMALIVTLAVFAFGWLFERDAYGKTRENRRGR